MSETQTAGDSFDSFAAMFESTAAASAESSGEGEIVKGLVVQVTKDSIVVDIGGKSEGVINKNEFTNAMGDVNIKVGDRVDVFIESRESDDGLISLSKEKADKMKVWDEISAACENDEIIEGTISQRVKGGLSVTIKGGVKAFLPGSQVDLRPIRNLDKLIGQTYEFKVIKFNKKRGNIVLSRRVLLEKERDSLKSKTLESLAEGQVLEGTIKNLTEYGAFVDLGGIDGLLHVTDMSWGRVSHPSEVFSVGDPVTVKVLKYNSETERVSLGMKQTQEDPWLNAPEAFPIGKRVSGKVMSLTDYGAFIELLPGVEGLIHVSEMSWTKKVKHPSKVLEVGQEVECQVLEVDSESKRISLGMKQLEPDPWSQFTDTYSPGDKISGTVRSITDYGIFVGIEDGVDGMAHKTDLSWTVKVNNPADLYAKGDEVQAIILSINHDEKKVSLGVKQVHDDPWGNILDKYKPGAVVEKVKIISIADFGTFVRLEPGIEAVVPANEVGADTALRPGDEVKAEVANVDGIDRRITMTLRNVGGTPQAEQYQALKKEASSSRTATLGDLMKEKLGAKLAGMSGGETPAPAEAEAAPAAEAAPEAQAETEAAPATEAETETKTEE